MPSFTNESVTLSVLEEYNLPYLLPKNPQFTEMKYKKWTLSKYEIPLMRGYYFGPQIIHQPMFKLMNKSVCWMSITPAELESQVFPVHYAHGHTIIAGLGMGIALYNILAKPQVTKVTLLEQDTDIITLMIKQGMKDWKGFDKLDIVIGDALQYKAKKKVDFLYTDIWPLFGQKECLYETKIMQENIQAKHVWFWSQELEFIDWVSERTDTPDEIKSHHFIEWVKATELPNIGIVLAELLVPLSIKAAINTYLR